MNILTFVGNGIKILTKMAKVKDKTITFEFELPRNHEIKSCVVGLSNFNIGIDNYYAPQTFLKLTIECGIPSINDYNKVIVSPSISINDGSLSKLQDLSFINITCIVYHAEFEIKNANEICYLSNIHQKDAKVTLTDGFSTPIDFLSGFSLDNTDNTEVTKLSVESGLRKNNNNSYTNSSYELSEFITLPNSESSIPTIQTGVVAFNKNNSNLIEIKQMNLTKEGIIHHKFKEQISEFAFIISKISFSSDNPQPFTSFFCNFRKDQMIKLLDDKKTVTGALDCFYFNNNLITKTTIPYRELTYYLLGAKKRRLGFQQLNKSPKKYSSLAMTYINGTNTFVNAFTDTYHNICYNIGNFNDQVPFSIENDESIQLSGVKGYELAITYFTLNNMYYVMLMYLDLNYNIQYISGVYNNKSFEINWSFPKPLYTSNELDNDTLTSKISISYSNHNNKLLISYIKGGKISWSYASVVITRNNLLFLQDISTPQDTGISALSFDSYFYFDRETYYIFFACNSPKENNLLLYCSLLSSDFKTIIPYKKFDLPYEGFNPKVTTYEEYLFIFCESNEGLINYSIMNDSEPLAILKAYSSSLSKIQAYNKYSNYHYTIENNIVFQFPFIYQNYLALLILYRTEKSDNLLLGTANFYPNDIMPYFY